MKVPECIILTPRHEVYVALGLALALGLLVGARWVRVTRFNIEQDETTYDWSALP